MLPSRPNAGRGLPPRNPVRPRNDDDDDDRPSRSGRSTVSSSNAAARSRSVGRPADRDRDTEHDRHTLKPRRSAANLREGDSRSTREYGSSRPPLPSDSRMSTYSAPDDARYRRSDISSSTTSSSGTSSFLDRLRAGKSGETSSRTSLEEDYEPPKRSRAGGPSQNEREHGRDRRRGDDDDRDTQRGKGERPVKKRVDGAGRKYDDAPEEAVGQGHGYSLWNAVSSAASNLTINVSKAWESNIVTHMGEETPPGQESRLLRAMKAYHLDKARSPSDLPPWLFDESERRARKPTPSATERRRQDRARDRDRSEEEEEYEEVPQSRNRGLRDIYDRAATATTVSPAPPRPQRSFGGSVDEGSSANVSKATNRLKALRDAKRAAATTTRHEDMNDDRDFEPAGGGRHRPEESDVRSAPPPRPRVGLPSGPARRY